MLKEPHFVFEYKITVSYFLFQCFYYFTARIVYSLLLCTCFGIMSVEINFTGPVLFNYFTKISFSLIDIFCGKN